MYSVIMFGECIQFSHDLMGIACVRVCVFRELNFHNLSISVGVALIRRHIAVCVSHNVFAGAVGYPILILMKLFYEYSFTRSQP